MQVGALDGELAWFYDEYDGDQDTEQRIGELTWIWLSACALRGTAQAGPIVR